MKNTLKNTGHALAALLVSGLGIALSPAVLGLVSPQVAIGITIAGVAYQSFTGKALQIAQPPAPVAPVVAPVVAAAPDSVVRKDS